MRAGKVGSISKASVADTFTATQLIEVETLEVVFRVGDGGCPGDRPCSMITMGMLSTTIGERNVKNENSWNEAPNFNSVRLRMSILKPITNTGGMKRDKMFEMTTDERMSGYIAVSIDLRDWPVVVRLKTSEMVKNNQMAMIIRRKYGQRERRYHSSYACWSSAD